MRSASYNPQNEVVTYMLPPTKKELSFRTFLWNSQTKAVLGRSGASWAKIAIFYVLFYAFLAAFFSIMMAVFFETINTQAPKFTGSDSVLVNPGLGIRPRPHSTVQKPAIEYDLSESSTYAHYFNSINKFLKPYRPRPTNATECQPGEGYRKAGDPVCFFDMYALGTTCSPANQWGYNTTSPCILLKLNRVFHWKPQPVTSLDGLPKGLQQHINTSRNADEALKQNAWVWCESKEIELEQNSPGLPLHYFPFHNQEGYLSPFSFVRLLDIPGDQSVEVRCRVWAQNVQHRMNLRSIGEAIIKVEVQSSPSPPSPGT